MKIIHYQIITTTIELPIPWHILHRVCWYSCNAKMMGRTCLTGGPIGVVGLGLTLNALHQFFTCTWHYSHTVCRGRCIGPQRSVRRCIRSFLHSCLLMLLCHVLYQSIRYPLEGCCVCFVLPEFPLLKLQHLCKNLKPSIKLIQIKFLFGIQKICLTWFFIHVFTWDVYATMYTKIGPFFFNRLCMVLWKSNFINDLHEEM